ncbi:MAG: hypothetical protein ACRDHN_03075 [Thermomicrobiales bacterium]
MDSDAAPPSRLRSVLIQIAIWGGVGFAISITTTLAFHHLPVDDRTLAAVCGSLSYGVIAWIVSRPFAMMWRAHKRQQVLDRAERYECLMCGYPLKGVARGGICPECGSPPGWVR